MNTPSARTAFVWSIAWVLALALAVIGAFPHRTAGAPQQITTSLTGAQLFSLACASCHGLTGAGRVFSMDRQTIKTPALTYARLSKMYNKNFDQQIRNAIVRGLDEEGKPLNPMMPRWTNLSPADIGKIIAYLKTLR